VDTQLANQTIPRPLVIEAIRDYLDELRRDILQGSRNQVPESEDLIADITRQIGLSIRACVRPVINGTGIFIDPLVFSQPSHQLNNSAEHGSLRCDGFGVESLLCSLTGAADAYLSSSFAALFHQSVQCLANGKAVVCATQDLIETMCGSRIRDLLDVTGLATREIGCSNRVHLKDYEQVADDTVGLILVTTSTSFSPVGFLSCPPISDLVTLARKRDVPIVVFDDLGVLAAPEIAPLTQLPHPRLSHIVATGVDLAIVPCDRLIGGPAVCAGLGSEDALEKVRAHPFHRGARVANVLRRDLELTLRHFLTPETLGRDHHLYRALHWSIDELRARAESLQTQLSSNQSVAVSHKESMASLWREAPAWATLPSVQLTVGPLPDAQRLRDNLFEGEQSVLMNVRDDSLSMDLRSVFPEQDELIRRAVMRLSCKY